jgi:cytochrome c biogenesis protein CcmG/thiol:disulfide interchange protein DsbE
MQGKKGRREKRFSLGDAVIVGIALIAIIWGAYTFGVPHPSATTTTSQTGGAPDFTLPVVDQTGLTGQSLSLSAFRGKVILLEFMVPWCTHCQKMAPVLEQLYQQFGSQNVVFLSVSGAWNGATANDAAQFIRAYQATYTFVFDSSNAIFTMYGVNSTPTFFLITKNGQIASTYQGEVTYDTLAADITRLNA